MARGSVLEFNGGIIIGIDKGLIDCRVGRVAVLCRAWAL
jgi:hypothetical protein